MEAVSRGPFGGVKCFETIGQLSTYLFLNISLLFMFLSPLPIRSISLPTATPPPPFFSYAAFYWSTSIAYTPLRNVIDFFRDEILFGCQNDNTKCLVCLKRFPMELQAEQICKLCNNTVKYTAGKGRGIFCALDVNYNSLQGWYISHILWNAQQFCYADNDWSSYLTRTCGLR